MNEDTKKEAWQRRCSQLETLGLDPYDPQPDDEVRRLQAQAILKEYDVAIGKVIPVLPGWEGNPPLRAITTLADLAAWLNDQWASTRATEMGGETYKADALEQAARAVRNGFRVLDWLGVGERPDRPLPAESLPVAKQQLDALERWVRLKVKDGWTPLMPSQPEPVVVDTTTTGKRRKRADFPDEYEVNLLVHKYLSQNPRTGIRKVAEAVGFSVGTVQKTEARRLKEKRRKAEKPPKIKELQLSTKMLANISKEDSTDEVDDRIDRREATWRGIIEQATPIERATLNAMSKNDKEALIDKTEEQNADTKEEEKRRRWRRRECS